MIPPRKFSTTSTPFPEVHTPAAMAEILPAVGAVAGVLRVTYQLITLAIESGQVSDEVRRSLELVRTCERDLQHLVGLREEYLDILERKPIELDRVNTIIRAAHQGLAEVCKIVEKCRPEANQGRIPFKRRSRWIFLDSTDFYTQIPVVSGHHRAVLNEISFLRQIALQAPVPVPDQVQSEKVGLSRKKSVGIDNIALLGNIMGGKAGDTQPREIETWYRILLLTTTMRTLASLSTRLRHRRTGLLIMSKALLASDLGLQRQRQVIHGLIKEAARRCDIANRDISTLPISRRPDALRAHYMTHFGTLLSEDLQALIQILFINPGPLIRYHRHVKISIT
ncbi:hypothetical protein FOXYSP1_06451 [Fusarium oxysporum f. sp. phaseoli]